MAALEHQTGTMRTLHPSSPEPPTDGYTPSRTEGLSLPGVLFDPSVEPAEKDEVDRDGDKKQGSENEVSVDCTYRHTPVEPPGRQEEVYRHR